MEQYKLPSHNNPDKIFIVNRSELEGRIDPYFFKKEFDVISDKLSHIETLPLKKVSVKIFSGITPLSGGDSYTDRENGIAFIRSGDYSEDNIIDFSSTNYITTSVHNGIMSSSKIKKGDLLIAIVGATIGKVGIYNYDEEANINQAICAIRLKEQLIPEFIHIYLLTTLGQKILDRLKRPVARANINLEEISSIQIPQITRTRQKEVVDFYYNRINLKQRKESEAKVLLESIDSYLLGELGIVLPEKDNSLEKRVFTTQFSEITANRIDSYYYKAEFKKLYAIIDKSENQVLTIKDCIHSITNGFDFRDYATSGNPYIKVANVRPYEFDFNNIQYINLSSSELTKSIQLKRGNLLLTRKGSFGIALALDKDYDYIISSEVFYLDLKNDIICSGYMEAFFNSSIGQMIFDRIKIGAIMGSLSQEAVLNMRIPLPPLEKQNEIARHTQSIREQAKQLQNDAKAILEQAKQKVELMILG